MYQRALKDMKSYGQGVEMGKNTLGSTHFALNLESP